MSEKSTYYTRWVNRFIYAIIYILYMIHSSNLVLRSEGWVCIFFLEDICDIVFGLFDTRIKQLI